MNALTTIVSVKEKGLCLFVLRIACNVRLSAIFHNEFLLREKNVQFLDR